MVNLIAQTPLETILPVNVGDISLIEVAPSFITSITPFNNCEKQLAAALAKAHDLALPAPGRSSMAAGLRLSWFGRGQYLLLGDKAASKTLAKSAALTDQSDGWAVIQLTGDNAAEVMARLTPLDLRPSTFKRDHTARTEVAHMMASVTRLQKGFEIMVMRSFAQTVMHHIHDAMKRVAVIM